jgi:hypothetical protein
VVDGTGGLSVTNDAIIGGLSVTNDATIGGTLLVSGVATDTSTISTGLVVDGTGGLSVTNDAIIGGNVTIGGAVYKNVRTELVDTTLGDDYILNMNITGAVTQTVTLPQISLVVGVSYIIVKMNSACDINITCAAGDSFASTATSFVVDERSDYAHTSVVNNGFVWMVV